MTPLSPEPSPAGAPAARRGALARGLRLLVGIGLMAGLFYYANPADVGAVLAGTIPAWIALAVAIVIIDRVANAYRWLMLVRAIEPARHIAAGAAMRVFFVSGFLGSFLPGSIGGDAVRTLSLSRLQVPPADALASVVVDRLLGVVSVLLMSAVSLVIVGGRLETGMQVALWMSIGGLLLMCALLLYESPMVTTVATTLAGRRLPAVTRVIGRALGAIRQYGRHRRTLGAVLALSVGVQVLRTFQAWTLGQALGIDAALVWYFAFLPLIILVMLLPTSVAGLGTGALAFQLLFGTVGVSPAECFSLAVLFSGLSIVGTLPGAFLLFPGRR